MNAPFTDLKADGAIRPIGVFYWRGRNFGDALSRDVVAHVSRRPAVWAPVETCELFAAGSVLSLIGGKLDSAEADHPRLMWGSGMLSPHETGHFMDKIRVVALRGPLTAEIANCSPALPFGDPGLFADELLDQRPPQTDRIGVVPHWRLVDTPAMDALRTHPRIELIDPRTTDAVSVIRRIAACRFVLSSSLHGLIVADALGIPNHWLAPHGNHAAPTFKFIDYAAAVGRRLGAPLAPEDVPAFLSGPLPRTIPYLDGIAAAREALRGSFPAELRAH